MCDYYNIGLVSQSEQGQSSDFLEAEVVEKMSAARIGADAANLSNGARTND